MKLKVFVLKVATIGPFYGRNVITRADLPNGAVPGARVQNDGKTFLVFTYIWQEDVAKIFKVPGVSHIVNPALAIPWLQGVTIYCTIFQ